MESEAILGYSGLCLKVKKQKLAKNEGVGLYNPLDLFQLQLFFVA